MRFVHNMHNGDTATVRMSINTCHLRDNTIPLTTGLSVKCGAGWGRPKKPLYTFTSS